MQLLLIKLPSANASSQAPLEVAEVTSKQKTATFQSSDWNAVHGLSSGKKVVVFIPNEDVLLTSITIPSKNKKQLLQAVPYALEERLADDIDALHFAVHRENNDSPTYVAVINQQKMEHWLTVLREHNIHPHYILPSLFSLPYKTDSWTLINRQNTACLRQNKWSGFSCDQNLLPVFLSEELNKNPPDAIYYSGEEQDYPDELKAFEHHTLSSANEVNHDDIVDSLTLNLLTDFNRGDSALLNINWKPWQPVIALAGFLGVLWIGILAWQNHQLDNKLTALDREIESIYKKTFPKSRIQNAPVQMKQKLAALQKANGSSHSSTLQAIATVSPFFKKFPKISLREIRHQNNELLFVISAPNLSSLENFKNTLAKEGALQVEIKSSTTTSDKVESTLVVKGMV